MEAEEARKVLKIMTSADCFCDHCAGALFEQFLEEYAEFIDIANDIWKDTYKYEYKNKDK
jgi:hypothetical protein